MKEQDAAIYSAWQHGRSIGDLAKAYKLDKSQVKKVINRVGKESRCGSAEVVYELPAEEASSGR
jgi:Mor family transcriptional regulator